jgi:hypothetical protein
MALIYIQPKCKTLKNIFSHTIGALDDFLPQNSEIFLESFPLQKFCPDNEKQIIQKNPAKYYSG